MLHLRDGQVSVPTMTEYTWESLSWRRIKEGVLSAHISLYPAEVLRVDDTWVIPGPVRVHFTWYPERNITRARYKKLRKRDFDIDNPREYPCLSCNAKRGEACVGNEPACAYRVFLISGGKL